MPNKKKQKQQSSSSTQKNSTSTYLFLLELMQNVFLYLEFRKTDQFKSNASFLQWTISFAFSSVVPIAFLPRQVISPAFVTLCASVTVSTDVVTIEYASGYVVRGCDIVVPLPFVSCVVSFNHHVISVTIG